MLLGSFVSSSSSLPHNHLSLSFAPLSPSRVMATNWLFKELPECYIILGFVFFFSGSTTSQFVLADFFVPAAAAAAAYQAH